MVTGQRKDNLSVSVKARTHEIISGLAEKLGGNDEGFDPHEMIEAALAACTILTCQLYANRKNWNLISTDVVVRITSETKEGATIQRDIQFQGDLTAEQKERLLEIANKCPIHNLLERKIEIQTSMI